MGVMGNVYLLRTGHTCDFPRSIDEMVSCEQHETWGKNKHIRTLSWTSISS